MFFILLLISTIIDFTLGILIHLYHSEERTYRKVRIWPFKQFEILDLSKEFSIQLRPWLGPYYGKIVRASFMLLSLILTAIDGLTSKFVSPENNKKKRFFYLITSVVANLGLLAYFKYTNFFIGTINEVAGSNIQFAHIFLPVGISFFTFQTMSYTIDIFRKRLTPVISILDFAFFVSFFPQLVAGPIVRAVDFLPQIRDKIRVTQEDIGKGLLLICTGLFKKAVISDYISVNFVDRVFENPSLYSGFENLMSIYGYALQIYCDFSGYSDMAIGIGLLLGFRLPINFLAPYQSKSIQEFWRRWHISLSSWLRDYLYISMGGNRKGQRRTYINLMMTMILGG
ncbi:MAG: MBOAT family protein, partial [Bacteroidetes bacterium]|nr:MBOAT family protein [Bacteroidota bacterium]